MSKYFFLLYLYIIFTSCNKSISDTNEVPYEVTIIFQNYPPDINYFRFPTGVFSRHTYDVSYMDSSMTFSKVVLKKTTGSDTIKIYTKNDVIEFLHNFNVSEFTSYLFHKGDSVLFTYKKKIPYVTILNRETPYHESNYDVFIREKVIKKEFSAIFYYRYTFFLLGIQKDKNEIVKMLKQGTDLMVEEWLKEHQILDSLHNISLLSRYVYDFRRSSLASRIYSEYIRDSTLVQYPELKKILADTVLFAVNNDSLLQFNYYRNYLQSKISNCIRGIKPIIINSKGSGSNTPNYFARFDTISNLDFLSAKAKYYFLTIEFENILESGNRIDFEKYCEKYISITGDSLFVNKLLAENIIDFSKINELLLIDRVSNQKNLQEVLEKNNGKVIYLDFWASWCAPCKESMPNAKQLREEYKDKDVIFIYLALNDEKERWIADEKKLEVNYLSESYFITNSKTAQILIDLNVREIPRYLLYNKKGELVHNNAPGPYGNEIREQINKLLNE